MNIDNAMPWSNTVAIVGIFVCVGFVVAVFMTGRWPWEKQ